MASLTERQLLFGVLALRLGFVDADALALALRKSIADPAQPLADRGRTNESGRSGERPLRTC